MILLAVTAPARAHCGVTDYARFLRLALEDHFEILPIDFPESEKRSDWIRAAAACDEARLVHVHYEYSLFRTVKPYRNRFATFMRRLEAPAVVTLHDLLPQLEPRRRMASPVKPRDLLRDLAYRPWFGRWEPRLYGLGDHWLVHTEGHRQAVARIVGTERVSRYLHPVPQADLEWSRPTGPPTLVSPGFVKPHKGYLRFLDVLQQLPDVSWIVAGGAQDEKDRVLVEELHRRTARCGLAERVQLTGYLGRSGIERQASAATLAVFPFDRVTGSGSVTWAIGLSMPIVSTDLPPLRELADAGAGLELLPLDSRESWADRIRALLVSPERLAALAAANHAFSRQHRYSDLGRRLAPLFESLVRPDDGRGDGR